MRRILIAIGTTLMGLVLLFSFPTSLNRIAAANAIGAAAATTAAAPAVAGTATADAAAKAAADAAAATAAADAAAAKASADAGAATAAADAAASKAAADAAAAATAAANTAAANAAAAAAAAPVTYDGTVASTRYGPVQVRITVSGGAVSAAQAIAYPSNDGQSRQISNYAVPVLNQEASAAKSAQIAMVSGATYTSTGYLKSLQSALDQAKL
ncbi:MAG: FMN-binding protein [Cellulomonas sp.]